MIVFQSQRGKRGQTTSIWAFISISLFLFVFSLARFLLLVQRRTHSWHKPAVLMQLMSHSATWIKLVCVFLSSSCCGMEFPKWDTHRNKYRLVREIQTWESRVYFVQQIWLPHISLVNPALRSAITSPPEPSFRLQ